MEDSNLFKDHEELQYLRRREKSEWLRTLVFFTLGFILGGAAVYYWAFFW